MTKSDISYSSVPTAIPAGSSSSSAEPYVQGVTVGSHAVTVILDEYEPHPGSPYAPGHQDVMFSGSRRPVQLSMCPQCQKSHVRTSTRTYPSALTWVGVAVAACVFFPLCWIPLVVDSMKQTDHFCQNCGKKIGTIKALEGCCVKEQM
mmetsp:Transcript_82457/g.229456  ORF Transcript_82457/g.229456 Transcript_82457/m.229456 type:complete len:148 (-) Transcript_82457:1162-1605(-)|eukprot:CAMPEP_0176247064 /NCGR_PEP_ID=MMETSP0121_2-20121125/32765_1 /TAXON_ID=160619 /ORGANISM="Kryptoperidinium foliaceum, Strain CCMP 1326" /LENGTH=147 /DNA_ID=CAMNT_0017586713 /DNA_START=16 /DNA_END=459 /DNA_ORIENTATION=-